MNFSRVFLHNMKSSTTLKMLAFAFSYDLTLLGQSQSLHLCWMKPLVVLLEIFGESCFRTFCFFKCKY